MDKWEFKLKYNKLFKAEAVLNGINSLILNGQVENNISNIWFDGSQYNYYNPLEKHHQYFENELELEKFIISKYYKKEFREERFGKLLRIISSRVDY